MKLLCLCIPSTLGFDQQSQTWDSLQCPCACSMDEWSKVCNVYITQIIRQCDAMTYDFDGMLRHAKSQSIDCPYHYGYLKFLETLYCTKEGILHPYHANPRRRSEMGKMELYQQSNRCLQDADSDSVSSTSSSSSDNNSAADLLPEMIDLTGFNAHNDRGGRNRYRQSQSSSVRARQEAWGNNVPEHVLPPLPILDTTDLPEEDLTGVISSITLQVFTDPVLADNGNTYERDYTEIWLKKNHISPITRQPMSLNTLCPNISIRQIIEGLGSKKKKGLSSSSSRVNTNEKFLPKLLSFNDVGLNDNLLQKIICPISREVFTDLVMADDGVTYDREEILKHLKDNDKNLQQTANPCLQKISCPI